MIMKSLLRKLFRNKSGVTVVEHGLLVAAIGLAASFGMKMFGDALFNLYVNIDAATTTETK
jgi:Flp pilus assembly pilin Flp